MGIARDYLPLRTTEEPGAEPGSSAREGPTHSAFEDLGGFSPGPACAGDIDDFDEEAGGLGVPTGVERYPRTRLLPALVAVIPAVLLVVAMALHLHSVDKGQGVPVVDATAARPVILSVPDLDEGVPGLIHLQGAALDLLTGEAADTDYHGSSQVPELASHLQSAASDLLTGATF
jgi:hypothetical protein